MKMVYVVGLAVGFLGTAVLLRPTTAAPDPKKSAAQWEYKVLWRSDLTVLGNPEIDRYGRNVNTAEHYEAGLKKLGADGWELVAVSSTQAGSENFYLKRPK